MTPLPSEAVLFKPRRMSRQIIDEILLLQSIEKTTTPQEIRGILTGILERETQICPNFDLIPLINKNPKTKNFLQQWRSAFLQTISFYRDNANSYADIVTITQKNTYTLDSVQSVLTEKMGVFQKIEALETSHIDPSLIGKYEAHRMIRLLAQMYFGRYSYDRRIQPQNRGRYSAKISAAESDEYSALRPGVFSHRQNVRLSLTGHHGIDDAALSLALYWEGLNEYGISMPTWLQARTLYDRQIFLIPGWEKIAKSRDYVTVRYGGVSEEARQRLAESKSIFKQDWIKATGAATSPRTAHENGQERDLEQWINGLSATICFPNSLGSGHAYAGRFPDDLFDPAIYCRDNYSPRAISYDWLTILDAWTKAEEELRLAPPKKIPAKAKKQNKKIKHARKKTAQRHRPQNKSKAPTLTP